jgi:hypothetical protein
MPTEKRESVYSVLSKILKLKFHSELKECGIEFNNIYKMTNLVTGKENYLVYANETEIKFVTSRDFVFHFTRFLTTNINALKVRYNELIAIQTNEFTDDIGIEMSYKQTDYYIFKQTELLTKINEFKNTL